jgi:hypothetical protein
MMEAVSMSEKSINFYQTTRRSIPEDSHLHVRKCVSTFKRSNIISEDYNFIFCLKNEIIQNIG